MYYHANLNFFRVKLNNPALLMLFFLFLCSASKLEYFEAISTHEAAPLLSNGVADLAAYLQRRDLKGAIAACSEYCYTSKYFCDFFVIQGLGITRACYLYNLASSFATALVPPNIEIKAAYRISPRKDIEPLEKRFSYDHETSLDDWVANIQDGYSLSSFNLPTNVLTGSVKAMNSKPATAIDFDKWVISNDISQSRRKPFEIHEFTGQKIMETVTAWQQFPNGNNQQPTEYFDTLLLVFLDIFCPHLQPGITTIYDPVKKVVFITKEDLHILVVSYGPGEFAVVQSKDNFQSPGGDPLVFLSNSLRRESNTPGNIVELFVQATRKSFVNPIYEPIPGVLENEQISTLLSVLNIVVLYLSADYLPNLNRHPLSGPLVIFYRDLITAVLSSVYKNYEHPIVTNLKAMQTGDFFGDMSFLYPHKSE